MTSNLKNRRDEIVWHWYMNAQQYWLLSRVAEYELVFSHTAYHVHALATETIIKTAIISIDERSADWATFKSREMFPEGHNIVKLLSRWNSIAPNYSILPESDICLTRSFSQEKDEFVNTPETFGSLNEYQDLAMTGRYHDGVTRWADMAFHAANIVFFRLRTYTKSFLKLDIDLIDRALEGNCGRVKDAKWLQRATKKRNVGLPPEQRKFDE